MEKQRLRIIGIAVFLGLTMAILDNVLDYHIFKNPELINLLIFRVAPHELYIQILNITLFLILGIILAQYIDKAKQAETILITKEQQLSALTAQLLNMHEIERSRISRELHDELGQSMMFLKFQFSSICDRLGAEHEPLTNECELLLGHLDKFIEDIRHFAKDLSPVLLEDLGLSSAVQFLVEEFCRNLNITCNIEIDAVDDLLPPQVQLNLYRIFQESLTNISKHSGATNISCLLKHRTDHIYVEIRDNGKGFDLKGVLSHHPKLKRFGLATINERARLIGGVLEVSSQVGSGTRISLTVPLGGGQ
jgi:two-component system, NarL family, sensor histidine kinase UhpB